MESNVQIVLDRSESMLETVRSGLIRRTKWEVAKDAIQAVADKQQNVLRMGLETFEGNQLCSEGNVPVPVDIGRASAIRQALAATSPGGSTPITAGLRLAGRQTALADPTRANFVLLLTDGKQTCPDVSPVLAVQALRLQNIRTYVVGFGSGVDPLELQSMAIFGGTGRAGLQKYYQADDEQTLQAVLDEVALGARGCDFRLQSAPPDASKVFVYVDGAQITRDTAKEQGWDLLDSTRLGLFGPACELVAKNPSAKISIVYGCPDSKIASGDGSILN